MVSVPSMTAIAIGLTMKRMAAARTDQASDIFLSDFRSQFVTTFGNIYFELLFVHISTTLFLQTFSQDL